MSTDIERLRSLVRDIPDFPNPGIVFKDITPLLGDRQAFATAVDAIVDRFVGAGIDVVLGIEARGFILAAPVAYRLGAGFVPARKKGKLPFQTRGVSYELEYGVESLELHLDAVEPGQRVLIVDDVLATGGTARAACDLVGESSGVVAGVAVLIELGSLEGRSKLDDVELVSLLRYE